MIELYDEETGARVGDITDEELKFLEDNLEEESADDDDYYFNVDMLDMLVAKGAPRHLLHVLERALTGRTDADVRWVRMTRKAPKGEGHDG